MDKKMSHKRLLGIDLDGTLLDDHKLISQENLAGLKKAQKHDIIIAIATGRPVAAALDVIGEHDLDCYLISHNGALIIDLSTGREVFMRAMDEEAAYEIIRFCIAQNEPLHIFGSEYWGVTGVNRYVDEFIARHNLELNLIENVSQLDGIPIINLTSVGNTHKVGSFIEKNGLDAYFIDSVPSIMDITHSKATKGNALRELAVKLGVGAGRILSIGNYYNDVEMFAASAVGIAVQNSPEEVKRHADYVTNSSNNEHAVLEALERFILP